MSGLSHTPGKRARGKTLRGFESRLLRQMVSNHAPFGAFCFFATHTQHAPTVDNGLVFRYWPSAKPIR